MSFTVVTVPASWTWWPEKEEHHEYIYEGSDELASEQLQKGKGSALQGLKNRIWSRDTHTHTLYGT